MTRPRILLTGAQGQVGFELARLLAPQGEVTATDRTLLDLASADAIVAAMRAHKPDLVVNAGAYTAVDLAERERDAAFAVNARAPQVFAEEAKRIGALLVHYSTDYVFDGTATTPYDEAAPTAPLNVYGQSKLAGEQAIAASGAAALILRTSWVYGLHGKNFLRTIQRLAAERDELRIVADQTGTPNWARTLAEGDGARGRARPRRPARACGPLSHELHGRDDLAWIRVGDRRRCGAATRRAHRDGRLSDAGPSSGLWRARHRALRADVRLRAGELAGRIGRVPRGRSGDGALNLARRRDSNPGSR